MHKKPAVKRKRRKSKMSGVRKHRRKSRVGNAGGLDFTAILLTIGGAVGASLIDKVIPESVDKKLLAGGKLALGLVLPMVSKDAKTKAMLSSIGNGFLAVGTIDLLKELNVLSGTEDGNDLFIAMSGTMDVLAGEDDINVVNGNNNQRVLAGEVEDLSIVNGYAMSGNGSDDDDDDM